MFDDNQKERCLKLYLSGCSFAEISKQTGVNRKTLYRWKKNINWGETEKSNFAGREKIESELSELVVKLINIVKQNPNTETLTNLENAVRIHDEHKKALLPK